jgi:hypothetical protein
MGVRPPPSALSDLVSRKPHSPNCPITDFTFWSSVKLTGNAAGSVAYDWWVADGETRSRISGNLSGSQTGGRGIFEFDSPVNTFTAEISAGPSAGWPDPDKYSGSFEIIDFGQTFSTVPELTSIFLLVTGLGGLALAAWRKRK